LLAHRAALLSVRMDKLGERQILAVETNKGEARDRFDRERFDEIEVWIKDLDDPETRKTALEVLEASPEGVEYLILIWEQTLGAIRAGDSDNDHEKNISSGRAALWLGTSVEEADASMQGQSHQIAAELARLRIKADSLTGMAEKIDALREQAATLARFDPSPEATLARRYEAAAERGMYRAMRAIAEIRRGREVDLPPIPPAEPAPPSPIAGEPVDPPRPSAAPLGSFRAENLAAAGPEIKSPLAPLEPPLLADEPRRKRPDLRKLAKSRR